VLIDWFTVCAQLLNFIVLVWLMKRYLYQPVLDAIAAREQKIAAQLADAAAAKAEAHRQQDEYQQKNQAFDAQRADLLQQAREAAKAERDRLQSEARAAADAASDARARALLRDAQQLRAEMTHRLQDQVFDISRRVLQDLASVSLEQQACEIFIQRLQAVDDAVLALLGAALKGASDDEPALLRSAFDLPAAQRSAVQAALEDAFGQVIPLKFETTPELVAGIELGAQGQKLAWSVSEYLSALSSGLEEQLGAAGPA
jgi:F-type H+-transporting ATPase subunit b